MKTLIALLLLTTAAHADDMKQCGPHDDQIAQLKERYGDTVQSRGLNYDGRMAEITANQAKDKGTWTMVLTDPSGQSCLILGGKMFTIIPPGNPA